MATQMSDLEAAMWAGDLDALCELAPCKCCCFEHTFSTCPARAWGGCRGQDAPDGHAWAEYYMQARGWTVARFFFSDEEAVTDDDAWAEYYVRARGWTMAQFFPSNEQDESHETN